MSHPTLVIESAPRLWHKEVGKANHVVETREEKESRRARWREERERREEKDRTRVRAQVVAEAGGGSGWVGSGVTVLVI